MTLSIRNPGVEARVRRMAARTGQSITAVVDAALTEYEQRRAAEAKSDGLGDLEDMFRVWDAVPATDPRSAKELMDELYDEYGLPA